MGTGLRGRIGRWGSLLAAVSAVLVGYGGSAGAGCPTGRTCGPSDAVVQLTFGVGVSALVVALAVALIAGAGARAVVRVLLGLAAGCLVTAARGGWGGGGGYAVRPALTAAAVLATVAVVLAGAAAMTRDIRRQEKELQEIGREAIGTVLSAHKTGWLEDGQPRVRMRLRIDPGRGAPSFYRELTETVPPTAVPRVGDRYRLTYHPRNREFMVLNGLLPPEDEPGTSSTERADTVIDQLTKLDALRRSGALTEAEFQAQKARLLAE